MIKDLQHLTSFCCPSGYENDICQFLVNEFHNLNVEYYVDAVGNVIVKKNGTQDNSIMLMAHMDEVGLMVTFIDDNGYIYFDKVGGVMPEIIPGVQVVIRHSQSTVNGIVGVPIWDRDHHLDCHFGGLWIDIGARSKEEALELVAVGDYVSYSPSFLRLNNDLICSKSLDNRVGVYIILQVFKRLAQDVTEKNIYAVFSAKEEIGCIGSVSATCSINPVEGIIVDMTHATDYPTCEPTRRGDIRINQGVAIGVGADTSIAISQKLIQLSQKNGIRYQIEPFTQNSYTEANAVQKVNSGVKTSVVSIPCRYMHSPQEICGLKDIEEAIRLLCLYCSGKR